MRIFVEQSYDGDSVEQTVRHALDILHAAGIFLNVGGGSANGHALALVEQGDGTRALAAFRRAEIRAVAE